MSYSLIISLIVNGVAMGIVYATIGMGLILLIRAVGVLNFAQGDMLMFGAYICAALLLDIKLPVWLMVIVAVFSFFFLGVVFMFVTYWPLRKASYPVATVIATMGASIVLNQAATLIWGNLPRSIKHFVLNDAGKTAVLKLGKLTLDYHYLIIIAVGTLMMIAVYVLFERLYVGKIMQAASQDQYVANLIGIPTIVTIALTYGIVAILVGTSGYLVSPVFFVRTTLATLQLRAFAGVVIGGFGNIKGAVIGSILVGLIESFSSVLFSEYRDVTIFLILLIFLLIRPQGIFGSKLGDKA